MLRRYRTGSVSSDHGHSGRPRHDLPRGSAFFVRPPCPFPHSASKVSEPSLRRGSTWMFSQVRSNRPLQRHD